MNNRKVCQFYAIEMLYCIKVYFLCKAGVIIAQKVFFLPKKVSDMKTIMLN